ncbi:group II intron reverse transcriptase/maturase [Ktedonobacter sp. SOSP1-52]|uniref:group II intron reverse transcriptase/maturase n=1 Tax=Ktedonobacter sp. SOSP1-52 TaxID=2778366 RepID=UPI00191699F3|nr:group II intron reverse transcriptase/maturase [Ktedonobacter sp. SOSP1-52]GHO71732.1 group II intron reverse transcriptase/maturase [Ktedonobacter sp. SOSP1-52]
MNTEQKPMYEWNTLPWRVIERSVFKLQKRIYQASQAGDTDRVHKLQRLLLSSWSAKCLTVRRVTQDNQGKKTAGVDGIKSLTPQQRIHLIQRLRVDLKTDPVRRVWIPKPNNPAEKRGLGIPTLFNRAAQMLAKLALEPEWEAKFESNSYGFRPGRSCHDAIQAIYGSINQKPKYVLDADIAHCFDQIDQSALLAKLHTFPLLRRVIKTWLKAGVMENGAWFPTEKGTPQGGVCSPLLANIALHGLEEALTAAFPSTHHGERWKPTVVRYADDFVVLHPEKTAIEQIQQLAQNWLTGMGLTLKASKTHITHTLSPDEGQVGFDFLGFHIQQFPVSKMHAGKTHDGKLLGFKTIITPSATTVKRHQQAIKERIKRDQALPQAVLITHLNLLIRGWARYYAPVCAKRCYGQMDTYLFQQLWHWSKRRHPNKSGKWRAKAYWHPEKGRWQFATEQGALTLHRMTPIKRHVKVQAKKSPFDGDWIYWTKRQGTHPETPPKMAYLLKRQQGKCAWCNLYLKDGDQLEIDHRLPRVHGGTDGYANLQLMHRHCHDQKTATDGFSTKGTFDKSQIIEEPDDANGSRPVLKPSGGGNPVA